MKTSDLSKEMLIEIIDKYLFGWAYKSIKQAAIDGEAKLSGFTLGACFIDALAGFYAGIDKKASEHNSGNRFKVFVEKYLTQYDKEKLWKDLRCGLVHAYATGDTYVFVHARQDLHLKKTTSGEIILNLENFYNELGDVYNSYKADIIADDEVFQKAKYRLISMSIMGYRDINLPNSQGIDTGFAQASGTSINSLF